MYEEVRNHKTAVDFVREASVAKKPPAVDLELVRKLYALLTPEEAAKGYPYRRENPLHRLYYHEIAAPEKITYRMRKLGEWMESDEFADLHPITRAVKAHFRLLSIYPWTKNSGKVARLLMNFILIKHGYLPAVIHSIERQRYYEVLRFENDGLEPGRRVAREQHRDDRQVPRRAQRPARQARQLSPRSRPADRPDAPLAAERRVRLRCQPRSERGAARALESTRSERRPPDQIRNAPGRLAPPARSGSARGLVRG